MLCAKWRPFCLGLNVHIDFLQEPKLANYIVDATALRVGSYTNISS